MRDVEHEIWNSWWRLDDDGLEDFVSESEYLDEDSSDDEKQSAYTEYVFDLLDDERANLNIPVNGTILMYGDAGRWDGAHYGASPCGDNISGIFDMFDYGDNEVVFYVEDGDVYARWSGHDNPMGTLALFRLADDDYLEQIEYEGIHGEDDFRANTESIAPQVCAVYGW